MRVFYPNTYHTFRDSYMLDFLQDFFIDTFLGHIFLGVSYANFEHSILSPIFTIFCLKRLNLQNITNPGSRPCVF